MVQSDHCLGSLFIHSWKREFVIYHVLFNIFDPVFVGVCCKAAREIEQNSLVDMSHRKCRPV